MPEATPTLFTPVKIGAIELKHRVVMAPLTRNRGTPSSTVPRAWVPNQLMCEYYGERATNGGLIISEATPVCPTGSGLPGVPGMYLDEQVAGWKSVTDTIHDKGGKAFCQLWHQGRNTHSRVIGTLPVSSSAIPITDSPHAWIGYEPVPFEVPHALTTEEIADVQNDFVKAAVRATTEAGYDGVETHCCNGYLFDQFHHSNINQRTDAYGGSIEGRCRFTLETVEKICQAIGPGRLGVRLAPYGLFNQSRGEERLEQWTYLCRELSKFPLAYVHLIEPRFDEIKTETEKMIELGVAPSHAAEVTLKPYRAALGPGIKVIAAGGFTLENAEEGLANAEHDLVAFGRYFCSNEDLVERLRTKAPLRPYNRARFYGPFTQNEIGYTVHPEREGLPMPKGDE